MEVVCKKKVTEFEEQILTCTWCINWGSPPRRTSPAHYADWQIFSRRWQTCIKVCLACLNACTKIWRRLLVNYLGHNNVVFVIDKTRRRLGDTIKSETTAAILLLPYVSPLFANIYQSDRPLQPPKGTWANNRSSRLTNTSRCSQNLPGRYIFLTLGIVNNFNTRVQHWKISREPTRSKPVSL